MFIPLFRFLLYSLVSSSFLVLMRYSFFNFSFISACLMVSASNNPKYLKVSFSPSVLIFAWFGNYIPFVICHFLLLIISMVFSYLRVSNVFSFVQAVWCRSCTLCGSYFIGLYEICCRQCISYIYDWMASLLSQKVIVITHLHRICLPGFSL